MKKITLLSLMALLVGCAKTPVSVQVDPGHIARFTSSDTALMSSYDWAQKMALSYSHDTTDPVGKWYEAALPQREAFCMRDVSHQTVGAQILGLEAHNLNMLGLFAANISPEKDWCSYWEINRLNQPAPADYLNDKEFWYNLNANFDVIDACLKVYRWTGDSTYITDQKFINFYEKSLNEYVERWDLQPEKIMQRARFMNTPDPFDPSKPFQSCRGLPSYVENFPGLTSSADLLATIYAGHRAFAEIEAIRGNESSSAKYAALATQYKDILNTQWWDPAANAFYTFYTEEGKFASGEGGTYIVWFDATESFDRITSTLSSLLSRDWNVENLSHFPALLYSYNYSQDAYEQLLKLPYMKRSEYPEVSYGVIEGVVGGMMGIQPDAAAGRVVTLPRLVSQTQWAEIENVPVFDGFITVRHDGNSSSFTNNTKKPITWRASFMGEIPKFNVNSQSVTPTQENDLMGNRVSYSDIEVAPGQTANVKF